jgi:hypothetical protein
VELSDTHLEWVPEAQRRDVIAFDWWVQNADRNLTPSGGNPNLLWNPADDGSLVVIDHNLAFDAEFSAEDFVKLHVFAGDIPAMFSDFLMRDAYTARFRQALGIWEDACATLPTSWGFVDPEQTIPVDFSKDAVKALLHRAFTDTFWHLPL